jgi:hypothetical protein
MFTNYKHRSTTAARILAASLALAPMVMHYAGLAVQAPELPYAIDASEAAKWDRLVAIGKASWEYSYRYARKWGTSADSWERRHDGLESGRWMDLAGWTVFALHASSKNVYWDPTAANDSANGLTSATPKKTYAAAAALCSAGDHILMKAGTTANSSTDEINFYNGSSAINGVDADHPALLGMYGTGARPIVNVQTNTAGVGFYGGGDRTNVAIQYINFEAQTRNPNHGSFNADHQINTPLGIGRSVLLTGFTVEGCRFAHTQYGIEMSGGSTTPGVYSDIISRRNTFFEQYGGATGTGTGETRAQGQFLSWFHNVTVEECRFLHVGWCEAAAVNVPRSITASVEVSPSPTTTVFDINVGIDKASGFWSVASNYRATVTSGGETIGVLSSVRISATVQRITMDAAFTLAPSGTVTFFSNRENMGRRSTEGHAYYASTSFGGVEIIRCIFLRCSGNDCQLRDGGDMFNCYSYGSGNGSFARYLASDISYNVFQAGTTGGSFQGNAFQIGQCDDGHVHHNIASLGGIQEAFVSYNDSTDGAHGSTATPSGNRNALIEHNIAYHWGNLGGFGFTATSVNAVDNVQFRYNQDVNTSSSSYGSYNYRPAAITNPSNRVAFYRNRGTNSTGSQIFSLTNNWGTARNLASFETFMENGNSFVGELHTHDNVFSGPVAAYPDPTRTLLTYHVNELSGDGLIATIIAMYDAEGSGDPADWNETTHSAIAINEYIRDGFGMESPETVNTAGPDASVVPTPGAWPWTDSTGKDSDDVGFDIDADLAEADAQLARCNVTSPTPAQVSDSLTITFAGLASAIPAGATITSVSVSIFNQDVSTTPGNLMFETVQWVSNGTLVGTNGGGGPMNYTGYGQQTFSLGTLTRAQLIASGTTGLRINLSAEDSSADGYGRVDYVSLSYGYVEGTGGGGTTTRRKLVLRRAKVMGVI